jgi:AraC-like DNA-binding protein
VTRNARGSRKNAQTFSLQESGAGTGRCDRDNIMDVLLTPLNAKLVRASANTNVLLDELHQPDVFAKDMFLLVVAQPNARITVQAGLAGLWLPLHGRTTLSTITYHVVATRGSVYASDSQRRLTVDVGRKAGCIAILARQAHWYAALAPWHDTPTMPYAVLPALHCAHINVRRSLVRFVRDALRSDSVPQLNLPRLGSALVELQHSFDEYIQRCPGTSLLARRSNFFRLQRAINQISFAEKDQPKVTELAQVANYSVHQFIRVFSKVFGVTPHAYMSRQLASRAQLILANGDLAVRDVAAALGIDSRATFARLVKKNLGQPASMVRRVTRSS